MAKQVEFLTIDVGSAYTKVNGFVEKDSCLEHIGQGMALTTKAQPGIGRGIFTAIEEFETRSSYDTDSCKVFASSSAHGLLRVIFIGSNSKLTSVIINYIDNNFCIKNEKIIIGDLSEYDIDDIEELRPDLIVLIGDKILKNKEIILINSLKLASMDLEAPVIYYGEASLKRPVENIFHRTASTINFIDINKDDNYFKLKEILFNSYSSLQLDKLPGIDKLKQLADNKVFSQDVSRFIASDLFCKQKEISSVVVYDFAASNLHVSTYVIDNTNLANSNLSCESYFICDYLENKSKIECLIKSTNLLDFTDVIFTGGNLKNCLEFKKSIKSLYLSNKMNDFSKLNVYLDENNIYSALGLIGIENSDLIKNTFVKWKPSND